VKQGLNQHSLIGVGMIELQIGLSEAGRFGLDVKFNDIPIKTFDII
jgi:hypothetical protein